MSTWRGTLVVLAVVLLAGCGATAGDNGATTPRPPTTSNADIESGCWTAADRQLNQEGSSDVVHQQWKQPPAMVIDPSRRYTATIETNKGSFDVEFYPQDAPKTVNNFICLARAGFYNGTPIHRIIKGFVIQGGDPTGTGTGGPGYRFEDEPITRDYEIGTLAMANAGPNTNGSQFFIVVGPDGTRLPKNYTIFGKVTSGMETVSAIADTPTRVNQRGEQSVPAEPVTIESVTVHETSSAQA
ncbi:MAG: hypothetical protein KatS3mg059_0150 [Thermomicrobiales bacterium]|nr:MAG: hypothetical protein KatS3mg059_0150 [Thermomicrobiales bacterium]